jgi:hypothetical protein
MIERPVNPGGRSGADLQSTYLPTLAVAYSSRIFLSYSGGRGGADLQRVCVWRRGSNRACGGADLTVHAAARI